MLARFVAAGNDVLPTGVRILAADRTAPNEPAGDHFDIVVANLTDALLGDLLALFSEEITNPRCRR